MIKFFKGLNKPFRVALIDLFATILCFAATSFLITTKMDIPFGILLGGGLLSLLNFAQGFAEIHDDKNKSSILSIIFIFIKFVVVVTILIIAALMTYRWNMKYFNIFAIIGAYTFNVCVTLLIYMTDKK